MGGIEIGGRKARRSKQYRTGHRRHQDRAVNGSLHRAHAATPVTGCAGSVSALHYKALRAHGLHWFTPGKHAVLINSAACLEQYIVGYSHACDTCLGCSLQAKGKQGGDYPVYPPGLHLPVDKETHDVRFPLRLVLLLIRVSLH
jgi:hypothetical protein